jgi:hypothetical protein
LGLVYAYEGTVIHFWRENHPLQTLFTLQNLKTNILTVAYVKNMLLIITAEEIYNYKFKALPNDPL